MDTLTIRCPDWVQFKACQLRNPMRLSTGSWNNPDMSLFCKIAIRYKRDPLPIGRIRRLFIFARSKGQLFRLAAGGSDKPDLVPVRFLQDHSQCCAVRRPRSRIDGPRPSWVVLRYVDIQRRTRRSARLLIERKHLQLAGKEF